MARVGPHMRVECEHCKERDCISTTLSLPNEDGNTIVEIDPLTARIAVIPWMSSHVGPVRVVDYHWPTH